MVAAERPDVAFVLVGRGVAPNSPPFAAAQANPLLADRLHFIGESKDVQRLMPGLDLMALTSAWAKAFPMSSAKPWPVRFPAW